MDEPGNARADAQAAPDVASKVVRQPGAQCIAAALLVIGLALFPVFGSGFYVDFVGKVMILAIFALSLQLLVGTCGLVSFGHAAYFGIAAYAAVLLSPKDASASMLWLMPASVLAAALYALLVGILCLRTRGVYFIMVTLAFAQMAYYIFHDTRLGGGSDGIYLSIRPALAIGNFKLIDLDRPLSIYYVVLLCLVATFALLSVLVQSRFGRALEGIRMSEQRMRALGFSTFFYKLAAFVIAGALAGVGGFLFALKDGYVNPEIMSWHQSGAVLMMLILGGLGRLAGAVLGAFTFSLLQLFFQHEAVFGDLARHWPLMLGVTVITCVAVMPSGLIGLGAQWRNRRSAAAPS